jgi:hypothetical protein
VTARPPGRSGGRAARTLPAGSAEHAQCLISGAGPSTCLPGSSS